MAVFTYKASNPQADHVVGTIAADTPRQARDRLRERGLIVTHLADTAPAPTNASRHVRRGMRPLVTIFLREMATLLGVGMPLMEALDVIASQHRGRFRTSVLLLRDRVSAGSALAAAMAEQPGVFDELCVNIASVGEDAGTLESSMEQLADFRERSEQLRGRISTALIYPAIVLLTALFASIFLMTFVVPRILEPLIEQGQPLPFPTRVVKGLSDFLLSWGWLLALIVFATGTIFAAVLRRENGKLWWHGLVLKLPIIGDLARKQAIVRIAVILSTLLKSGVVFLRATEIARRTTSNRVLRAALAQCEQAIAAGGDISEALKQSGAFPPMVVQIFALGQQSGRLEEMLDRLASGYDQQVTASAHRLTAVLEPVLIIVLALIVLFIVLATVLPILEAGNAIA